MLCSAMAAPASLLTRQATINIVFNRGLSLNIIGPGGFRQLRALRSSAPDRDVQVSRMHGCTGATLTRELPLPAHCALVQYLPEALNATYYCCRVNITAIFVKQVRKNGGPSATRTRDHRIKSPVLYQLS